MLSSPSKATASTATAVEAERKEKKEVNEEQSVISLSPSFQRALLERKQQLTDERKTDEEGKEEEKKQKGEGGEMKEGEWVQLWDTLFSRVRLALIESVTAPSLPHGPSILLLHYEARLPSCSSPFRSFFLCLSLIFCFC